MHIKYAGGEEFFERDNLEGDRITISLREEADTVEGELVAVTGSSGELGSWSRSSVVTLVRETEHR